MLTKSIRNRLLFNTPKRFIYYDNLDSNRNIDFVFNLGYNDLSTKVKSNLGFMKLTKFLFKKQLLSRIRHYYKHLIFSIEEGEIQIFDEILEKNLKYSLFLDLKKLYEKKYNFKVVNKNEPIFVKILNVYEMDNVNINRELNGEISEYDLAYSKDGNKIFLNKYDPYEQLKLEGRSYFDIEREKDAFYKSEYKDQAEKKFYDEAKIQYAFEYLKAKMGNKLSEKNAEYVSNLIDQLEKKEKKTDPYSLELKNQFADYYTNKEKKIQEKVKAADLYDYFRVTMPSHYDTFSKVFEAKKSFFSKLTSNIRQKFYRRFIAKSKHVSKEKTLFIVDVEVTSKMRLEIVNENNENVLDSDYFYSRKMKLSSFNTDSDHSSYDTSIYNFKIPDRKWNYNNPEFMQTHILRIEYERKNKFQNILKKPYNNMLITDIDFSLKGNKHFKFSKNYL